MHCVATVVLRKQLNFKSAVIRSNRSSCFICMTISTYRIEIIFTSVTKIFRHEKDLFNNKAIVLIL